MSGVSAFAAYSKGQSKNKTKPKQQQRNRKTNGAVKNGDSSFERDSSALEELFLDLMDTNKQLSKLEKDQRKGHPEQTTESSNESESDSEFTSDSNITEESSEQSESGSEETQQSASSSAAFSEEFTPNSSSTSPEIPQPKAKKREKEPEEDLNNNHSKQAKMQAPAAPASRLQQRKSLPNSISSLIKVQVKPASCPLVRKSLGKPNSCPLPSKAVKKVTKPPPVALLPKKEAHLVNSIEEGRRLLLWLLNPVTFDKFFKDFWEKNACQVQRGSPNYFSHLISFKMIDEMLLKHHLEFTTNIDVTSYTNGQRHTHNPEGRAMPPAIWGFYGEGCSLRILNPSTYLPGLRQLCSMLQEFFHCLVGANVYLTPPNSQGFAPHFDDIEAFVLQVEGRKRWRLYMPLKPCDVLARESSGNYSPQQLGEPIFDEVLQAGDVLYFPRGTVHQALTEKNSHSLHITLSVYQQQAYANLLEKLMPMVLQRAVKHNLALRRGLPLDMWQHLGLANGEMESKTRTQMISQIQEMAQKYLIPSEQQIDSAVDQLAKRFQHEALPPTISHEEQMRTVFGSRSESDAQGQCLCDYELTESTGVRLLRANILRLVADEGKLRVFYYVDNALEFCKYEANFMEIEPTEAGAIETLMRAYPAYVKISKLPLRSAERRVEVATALWERGLLMTEKPFK